MSVAVPYDPCTEFGKSNLSLLQADLVSSHSTLLCFTDVLFYKLKERPLQQPRDSDLLFCNRFIAVVWNQIRNVGGMPHCVTQHCGELQLKDCPRIHADSKLP